MVVTDVSKMLTDTFSCGIQCCCYLRVSRCKALQDVYLGHFRQVDEESRLTPKPMGTFNDYGQEKVVGGLKILGPR